MGKKSPESHLSVRSVLLPLAEVSTGHPHPLRRWDELPVSRKADFFLDINKKLCYYQISRIGKRVDNNNGIR